MRVVILAIVLLTVFTNTSFATQGFIPKNAKLVIAKWQNDTSSVPSEERVKALLNEAKYPGNSNNYSQASILLKHNKDRLPQSPQLIYYEALTKQYFHNFESSAELLRTLLSQQADHANARLLLSNIYAVQGNFNTARAMCTTLIGIVEPILIAACKLNIDAQSGSQEQVQEALDSLTKFVQLRPTDNIETAIYIDEIRASMASYIHNYQLSEEILTPYINEKAPVSFWVLWSDIQLALDKPSKVVEVVGDVVSQTTNQDDALLLRLALAENKINTNDTQWRKKIAERILLRETRQDEEHAFDIALYYFHIKKNFEVAYKWALINWQQAKLKEDASLLEEIREKLNSTKFSEKN